MLSLNGNAIWIIQCLGWELQSHHSKLPDKYKCEDPVQAYRNYYLGEKMYMAVWTEREVPSMDTIKTDNALFRKKIIITDLDGTISDCTHRLKYYRKNDYFKFNELGSEDLPITPIVNILRNLQE